MSSPDSPQVPDEIARGEQLAVSTSFEPDTGRRVKRGAGIAAIILLACLVIMSVMRLFDARALAKSSDEAAGQAPLVDTVIAKAPVAGQDLVLPGATAAWYDAMIYGRVNGYVGKWLVDIGDRVNKGQVLAIIETPELDAELSAAKAQLEASKSQVAARKAELDFSQTTNERWRDSPKGAVSDQERAAKKADFESAQARLFAAAAQVQLDKARVDQYRALAEFKQVRAPFDGTITERKIDVGMLVTAGSTSATTPLYRMSQSDPLRVFVDVPQAAAAELVKPGVGAEVRANDPGSPAYQGKTARSALSINQQARTMRVEVDLPNASQGLLPGMYVHVAFHLDAKGSVEVPAAALVFRAQGTQVARVAADGTIEFVNAVIARDDGSLVELASGVKPGDRLVLNISSQIAAGQKVSVSDGGAPRTAKE